MVVICPFVNRANDGAFLEFVEQVVVILLFLLIGYELLVQILDSYDQV